MPTPIPFNALRGQFIPNIPPLGEVNRQVERMKALGIKPTAPVAPVLGPTQPRGRMGFLSDVVSAAGTYLTNRFIGRPLEQQIYNAAAKVPGTAASFGLVNEEGTIFGGQPLTRFSAPIGPAYASAEALGLPTVKGGLGKDYTTQEIKQGRLAEPFRAGAGFPGQQVPIPPAFSAPVITAPPVPGQQAGNAGAMETYMQLKQQAKTPEDYKILDQLGMAIHQEKFGTPGMRMEQTIGTFNPLMAQMGLQQPTRPIIPDQEALVDRMDQQVLKAQEFLEKLTNNPTFNKKNKK